mmetsp:Transcript_64358/g.184812  ORF Transcript_64358/g.184812 Transcript_64358/m.184812 type:complete len:292 (+) Transcript_64358:878-1753(+)
MQHEVKEVWVLAGRARLFVDALLDDVIDDPIQRRHCLHHSSLRPEAERPKLWRQKHEIEEGVDGGLECDWKWVRFLRVEGVETRAHAAQCYSLQRHLDHVVVHVHGLPQGRLPPKRFHEAIRLFAHQRHHAQDASVREGLRQDLVRHCPLSIVVFCEEEAPAKDLVHQWVERASLERLPIASTRLVVPLDDFLNELRVPKHYVGLAEKGELANTDAGVDALQDQAALAIIEVVLPELEEGRQREEEPRRELDARDLPLLFLSQGPAQEQSRGHPDAGCTDECQSIFLRVHH